MGCGAVAVAAIIILVLPDGALAQADAPAAPAETPAPQVPAPAGAIKNTACGNALAAPAALPPPGSPPFIWILEPCFQRQGGFSTVENETDMYYIKLRPSQPTMFSPPFLMSSPAPSPRSAQATRFVTSNAPSTVLAGLTWS